ncbi:MAG: hypothetical protein IJE59_00740 [Clostridia bacterium]|nr:hypothetical protein [Clostridia bacterium]
MLSFREQIEDLKNRANIVDGKECERDVKAIANEILQDALERLEKKSCCLILDIQGIGVRVLNKTNICIDYIDNRNFFSFTLVLHSYEGSEYTMQVFESLKSILLDDHLRLESIHTDSFRAYF